MNCCDTEAWKRREKSIPRRLLLALGAVWLFSLLAEMMLMGLTSSSASWVMAAVEICAAALLVWKLPVGIVVVLVVWCVGYVLPVTLPGVFVYLGLFAMSVLGYVSLPMALVASLIFVFAECGMTFLPTFGAPQLSWPSILMLNITLVGCSVIGFIVRKVLERARKTTRQQSQAQRTEVSSELHDGVCNDLAYALMLMDEDPASSHAKRAVRKALESAHSSLRLLQQEADAPTVGGRTTSFSLGRLVRENSNRMAAIGLAGTVVISPEIETVQVTGAIKLLMEGFVRELFGNLAKYADHAHPYTLLIGTSSHDLHISLTDIPAADPPYRSTGSGLRDYKERIEQLGGSFAVDDTEGMWTLDVSIPCE
ncbi:sensor histidine kinase [Bifidobacterium cuniculi]|uniref:Signal transduction histidine kinase-like protein n=1 Tax=Bifidobacterium cuniculi TaxID=1688 RepID=A0A087AT42_9BIFI|nr:hypothetical protein [Bifidobacterium cuniculi]KFI61942.1 signal transduction histidine kinase-like protein [Bifidobacterium cuniculi]